MSGLYGVPVAVGRVGSAGEGAGEGGGGASSLACVPLMTRKG